MKKKASIIKYVSDSYSNESLSIGLLGINDNRFEFLQFSELKLKIIKRFNPNASNILDFSIHQLKSKFQKSRKSSIPYSDFGNLDDQLDRLNSYSNGLLQFSQPIELLENDSFYLLFNQYIGNIAIQEEKTERDPKRSYRKFIQQNLYMPLKDQINVDFELKKKDLSSLYFDFHIDAIGVNGRIYSAKALDLNFYSKNSELHKQLAEYESVVQRLQILSKSKNLDVSKNEFYLIVEEYNGESKSISDLSNLLRNERLPSIKVIPKKDIQIFKNKVIKNGAGKFSEFIANS